LANFEDCRNPQRNALPPWHSPQQTATDADIWSRRGSTAEVTTLANAENPARTHVVLRGNNFAYVNNNKLAVPTYSRENNALSSFNMWLISGFA
jgi:hypothetical protein